MEIKEFVEIAKWLRELNRTIFPDRWNYVCAGLGYSIKKSQELYGIFQEFSNGWIPYRKGRQVDESVLFEIVEIAKKASDIYTSYSGSVKIVGNESWYNSNAMAYWVPRKDKTAIQRMCVNLASIETYIAIADIARNENDILGITMQVDSISNTMGYVGDDKPENGLGIAIYEGDVFLSFDKSDDYFCDSRENGLYIAENGCYRKLLYTPGKGYVRKGSLDTDEDFEIAYGDDKFSQYILTLNHSFKRIGNAKINADFLIEKNK